MAPELAHSWRYQIPVLAAAGYHAVAPDMRGYGRSTIPEDLEAYDVPFVPATPTVAMLREAFGETSTPLPSKSVASPTRGWGGMCVGRSCPSGFAWARCSFRRLTRS